MTFKAATAKQAIRMVAVPVKGMIATTFQRTRPQARRRKWLVSAGLLFGTAPGMLWPPQLEAVICERHSAAAIGSVPEAMLPFFVARADDGSLPPVSSTLIAERLQKG